MMAYLRKPLFCLLASNLMLWGASYGLRWVDLRPLPLVELPSRRVIDPGLTKVSSSLAEPVAVLAETSASVAVDAALGSVELEPSTRAVLPLPSAPPLLEVPPAPIDPPFTLMEELKGAAGLGGPITLESLEEPLVPIAARVERQQQKRSGDSLAALPLHWRGSLRRALPSAMPVSQAVVVRLPVPALKRRQEVPVIINEHGKGEALVAPEDRRVREAVEGWAARQMAAPVGTVQVYVVAAEPLFLE